MNDPEWCLAQMPPYKRVEQRVAITVGMAVVYGEREVAVKFKVVVGWRYRIPRSDNRDRFAVGDKPLDIILHRQCDTVKHRWKTVVEQPVDIMSVSVACHNTQN